MESTPAIERQPSRMSQRPKMPPGGYAGLHSNGKEQPNDFDAQAQHQKAQSLAKKQISMKINQDVHRKCLQLLEKIRENTDWKNLEHQGSQYPEFKS
jgi:hypothetical protein